MSGERPTLPDDGRPKAGTAAGTPYFALPPTAVDARPAGATRLVLGWPGFDPPRGAGALAAAVPLTGVPTWRVYLELPGTGPAFDSAGLLEGHGLEAYAAAVERAVEDLPAVVAAVRADLGIEDGPVGLTGFSVGATVALLALAAGAVPVSTAAAVSPIVSPALAALPMERRSGRERAWNAAATALAERLDLGAHAARIAERDVPLLFVGGATDRVMPMREVSGLCDRLRDEGASTVETATFRMGHALVTEPGTDPRPPSTEAVRVDAALTDWFRERLAEVGRAATSADLPAALRIAGELRAASAAAAPAAKAAPEPSMDRTAVDGLIVPRPSMDGPLDGPVVEGTVVDLPPVRGPMGSGPPADPPHAPPAPAPERDGVREPWGLEVRGRR